MAVLNRIVKPKSHKGKKILLKRESQVIEGVKSAVFLKGRKCSEKVRTLLNDLYNLKKPDGTMLSRKNDITLFEDPTPVETFCKRHNAGLFVLGSHNKKRPNNLVIGRVFNYALLDMIELSVEEYQSLKEFPNEKIPLGTKPTLIFNGETWEQLESLKHLKSVFIDFFHKEEVPSIRLQGLEHTISFTHSPDGKIILRSYKVFLKKSGLRTPRVELEEIGPRIEFMIRRAKLPTEDLLKESLKTQKETKSASKKNSLIDGVGNTQGRIHIGKQAIDKLQTRKMKGLKNKQKANKKNVSPVK